MDKQEAFNKAYLGLKSQGFKMSVLNSGMCVYRTEGGLKCAVGWLIPDDKYSPEMDDTSMGSGISRNLLVQEVLGIKGKRAAIDFLFYLQGVHDSGADQDMQEGLKKFAKNYKLTIPEE